QSDAQRHWPDFSHFLKPTAAPTYPRHFRPLIGRPAPPESPALRRYTPALLDALREGLTSRAILRAALAGPTVAIIAPPLAMAFGIAALPEHAAAELAAALPWLTPPAMGISPAIVGGFLISALGGSRVQIGGPTGAFIVIVYAI